MKQSCLNAVFMLILVSLPRLAVAGQEVNYIVIAADQSGSMYSHGGLALQNEAMTSAIDEYVERCGDVFVVYMPWGSEPFDAVRYVLSTREDREQFKYDLQHVFGWKNLAGTNHGYAIANALSEIEKIGAAEAVLLFTTDESGKPVEAHVPDGIILFKVSIGSESTAGYLRKEFLPGRGFHQHANTADDLKHIINDVFLTATPGCLG